MKPYRSALRRLGLTSALVLLSVASAHAVDTEAFGARLKAVVTQQGAEINWTGISEDGNQVVLSGVTIGAPGKPDEKVELGDVTLEDVTEENGGYKIGTLSLEDFSQTQDGTTVSISGVSISGLSVPAEGADAISAMMMYQSADMASMSVKQGDAEVFALNALHFEITPPADGKPMEFSGAAESFTADLTKTEDAQTKAVIEAMGYQNIKGSLELAGSWQPTDGRMALSQYDISVENAGTLGMTFDLGGYTPEFIKELQEMQKQMAANPGGDSSAQGMAMLGMMQKLTFHTASIRWDDDSLTQKIIDFAAQSSGQKPEDLVNQAKATVPMMMAMGGISDADFVKQVTDAVNAYLTEPKSIEISAEPEQPVPFAMIMAGGMSGAPQELLKTLAVSVSANEDE
jgi:hypothetical protein